MSIEVEKITLPAYWASALVNGDYSGLDVHESIRCSHALDELARDGWSVAACEDESRFTWSYQLYDPGASCSGGEVLDYVILRRYKETRP
jgi:hypothetical protein